MFFFNILLQAYGGDEGERCVIGSRSISIFSLCPKNFISIPYRWPIMLVHLINLYWYNLCADTTQSPGVRIELDTSTQIVDNRTTKIVKGGVTYFLFRIQRTTPEKTSTVIITWNGTSGKNILSRRPRTRVGLVCVATTTIIE